MKWGKSIRGFTLLEILTAIAIVALMIGLLIPAIGTIKNTASTVKQKSQFSAIEISLEVFQTDSDLVDYPPSSYTRTTGVGPGADNTGYCGAQKLAEAIVGMDGFGFHPKSQWRSDGLIDTDNDGSGDFPIYYGAAGYAALTQAQKDQNFKARKGPYIELEKANAVKVSSLYPAGHDIYNVLNANTFILCDMFGMVKNLGTGKKTGMPILYYRADTNKTSLWPARINNIPGDPWHLDMNNVIYNVNENFTFLNYQVPWANIFSPMSTNRSVFYQKIANPNFTNPQRPYRAQSFILLSAGADGLYGTSDDVYNIDENDK